MEDFEDRPNINGIFEINGTILQENVKRDTDKAFKVFQRVGNSPVVAEIEHNVVANWNFTLARICTGMKYEIRNESQFHSETFTALSDATVFVAA